MELFKPPALVRTSRAVLEQEVKSLWTEFQRKADGLGKKLSELRDQCSAGEWLPLLDKIGIPRSTAYDLIKKFKGPDREGMSGAGHTGQNGCAEIKTPEEEDMGTSAHNGQAESSESEHGDAWEPPEPTVETGATPEDVQTLRTLGQNGLADKIEREQKIPKKPDVRQELKDQTGRILPDNCRDAFADPSLGKLIEELQHVEAMIRPESWTSRGGKLCDHYGFVLIDKFREHAFESLRELQLAREALEAGVPYAVCPKCNAVDSRSNGKTCKGCRGYGHVPQTRYTELSSK